MAAAIVFAVHTVLVLNGRSREIVLFLRQPNNQALAYFFALSGLVLTWSARPGDSFPAFLQRRVARIYPAYLVAVVVGVLVSAGAGDQPVAVGPVAASVFAVQSWVPEVGWYFGVNGPGWTVSVELFFYLVFPLLVRPIAGLSRTGRRRVQVAALTLALVISIGATSSGHVYFAEEFPPTRLLEFVIGCTLAIDLSRGEVIGKRVTSVGAAGITCAFWAVGVVPLTPVRSAALMIVPSYLLLSALVRQDLAGVRGFVSTRPMVWFGKISFCFYLVHQLVLRLVAALLANRFVLPGQGTPWAVLAFAVSTLAAWLLHVRVEVPYERRLRGTSRRKPPVPLQG